MNITRFLSSLFLALLFATGLSAQNRLQALTEDKFNFIVACDLGRNGHYDQKAVAAAMGDIAEEVGIEFVAAGGDTHHYGGIQSVQDPLWMTNYELIYTHPELQASWYPVLGNHEYRGNTQAVIDYSSVSRRWSMPGRYYTKVFEMEEGESIRLLFIDTAPLIDKYRTETEEYPDAVKQDMEKQLKWIDTTLEAAKEKWVVVIGHHPIYAETSKSDNERTDLQKRLAPILRKHKVDMYICGHIHNFQHIRKPGSDIDYVVNTSGSLSRKVKPIEGTQFCNSETGFSLLSADSHELILFMLNKEKEVLHRLVRRK